MRTVAHIIDFLEKFAPPALAANWDNVGLLIGDGNVAANKVMTCLTVTPETAAEAVELGAQLIVTHHPVLFRPVNRLTTRTAEGSMLLSLIKSNVAVYCPHTAFDNCNHGINDLIAQKLNLLEIGSLRKQEGSRKCKVVAFIPDSDLEKVSSAMFAASAGRIGQYSECGFRVSGTGTFFGSAETNPTVGQKGRREEVTEWRLEAVCPESQVGQVIAAIRETHSYEEPAFDVYPLLPAQGALGEGRVGKLKSPCKLAELAQLTRQMLQAGAVQYVGEPNKLVEHVAIVCGAGGEFIADAVRARADVLLTGEARFHDYLAARAQGLSLILAGHYATERCGAEALSERIQEEFPEVNVWASTREADPVSYA